MKKRNSALTVNLDAISSNVSALKSYLKSGVKFMAVVKADAYGHGAVEVARHLRSQVDWFAVNDIDEGIELRENGIKKNILVFTPPEDKFSDFYLQYNLTATISAKEHFQILPEGTSYHLNFDTGMGRLGFRPEEVDEVQQLQADHPKLQCTGIYSHFATADKLNSSKPKVQLQTFKRIREQFEPELITHMANTAGLVQYPEAQFDMIRSGIGIYGYSPGEVGIAELQPAMHWRTELVQVKSIKKGQTISYGANWEAKGEGVIGIIPTGYTDGIPRGLSGDFHVTIDGKIFPVIGTVTMNYCMIDLGGKALKPGTTVHFWNENHAAKEWAKTMNTISYEILTGVLNDIPRIYISE